jgi:CHAD domain-containing protein
MDRVMTNRTYQYYLPIGFEARVIFEHFSHLGRLLIEPPVRSQRIYLDTFDWRLHSAGSLLVEEHEPYETRLRWRKLGTNELIGQLMIEAPRFVRDMPQGVFRRDLEALVEMRALMPMAQVNLNCERALVLNKHKKTVLRLMIEEGFAGQAKQCTQPLPPRLRIEPIKGYRKPLQQALTVIEEKLRLEPASHLLDEALDLAGREAEDYSGKLDVQLQPAMPAGEAVRQILHHLLDTMERNLDGTRADLDSEFLHDFRVAVRRTRSLFSELKGVLPTEVLQRFRPGFKWLGQITGPTRDLDVYLLKLPGYRNSLPVAMQTDLGPLHAYLQKHQKQEQKKLARQLGSVRFRKLMQEWREFLKTEFAPANWPEKASLPIRDVANARTWKTYRLVVKEGEAITDSCPAEALHELRISCKKLRYLMEFFQSLHPRGEIRKQIKSLKSLQDNLGDFQDLEVQADALKGFGHAMQEEKSNLPSETFMAMGVLIDSLMQRQEIERKNFADRFARFARPDNRRACRELFKPASLR